MFKKTRNAMLALAAVATLGLGALVATTDSADARAGFHGGGGFRGGHIGGMRHIGGPRLGGAIADAGRRQQFRDGLAVG